VADLAYDFLGLSLPWAPTGMGKGALAPSWKCCRVFLCISSYSETLSRPILFII